MHRKFRQNSPAAGDPLFVNATGGHPCNCLSGRPSLEELHLHSKPQATAARPPLRPSRDHRLFGEEDYYYYEDDAGGGGTAAEEDHLHAAMDELLFHGLLAIGTLGSTGPTATGEDEATAADGSATPAFGVPPPSLESIIAEKEGTESEMKAINAELEKVLVPDPADKNDRLSSARPSHVSLKHMAAEVCPLQGYLFGSPVEMAETADSSATAAAEHRNRVSLGELFMKSRLSEEGGVASAAAGAGGKKGEEKERSAAGMHLMVKKMLKRRGSKIDASTRSSTPSSAGDVVTAETKFHKIMQMFHRKVHPESSLTAKKHAKSGRYDMHADVFGDGGATAGGSSRGGETTMMSSAKMVRSEGVQIFKIQTYPPASAPAPVSVCGSDSNGNREYWIKTDADYLVLEL